MTCEAKAQSNGKFLAYVNGQPLRSKKGVCRNFKSARAAEKAAFLARDGKDRRPEWRRNVVRFA
jgi:hypothetical protein